MVRDHGGPPGAPAVLLLHGLGGNALHWEEFAPLLADRYRVVAPDLRGHGRSGDGPFSWDALLDDVARVLDHLGVSNPAVVGHSLGGGVAALWAHRHPDCPGAVNLDGVRGVETTPDNYPGLDPDTARAQLAELTALFEAQAAAMAGPLPPGQLDALREQRHALGGAGSVTRLERNLVTRDGATWLRPGGDVAAAYRTSMMDFDLIRVFAETRCPLLVCTATITLPGAERFSDLLAAQRRGVERDMAAAARANPQLRVERFDASHGMLHEQPAELAGLVREFLS